MSIDATAGVDALALFTQYATAAAAQVQTVDSMEAAVAAIAALRQGTLTCTAAVRDAYPQLYAALAGPGGPVRVAEDVAMEAADSTALAAALAGGTGLILATAGVAETGSLLLTDNGLAPRLLSMLADYSIALLDAGSILPDLDAAGELMTRLEREGHRYQSLVTGPSRTADIERVLTIGVQGPKTLSIIVVRAP
ncbi:MAG TPA: LUD domain-containing protein, partial [Acetobacteraceae bacterium]|nr:LUD domain-containing protein [Acetobacteraceae bacterium]